MFWQLVAQGVKAHRLLYHSTLVLRVIKKKRRKVSGRRGEGGARGERVDGARPVHQIITMIKWTRTSRLSIKRVEGLDLDAPEATEREGGGVNGANHRDLHERASSRGPRRRG